MEMRFQMVLPDSSPFHVPARKYVFFLFLFRKITISQFLKKCEKQKNSSFCICRCIAVKLSMCSDCPDPGCLSHEHCASGLWLSSLCSSWEGHFPTATKCSAHIQCTQAEVAQSEPQCQNHRRPVPLRPLPKRPFRSAFNLQPSGEVLV